MVTDHYAEDEARWAERVDRLDQMIAEGRVVRGAWTEGRERACLLAALAPECGAAQSASACPAEVMPAWLAHLTPWLDDAPSAAAWPSIVARYAALARRWHVLDDAAWERARLASLVAIVCEARTHVSPEHGEVLRAIDGVLGWLRRGAPESERRAVLEAARAVAATAEKAARAATGAAAEAAAWAAWAARAVAATAEKAARAATGAAASAASADRIASGVLDAIEREIERGEGTAMTDHHHDEDEARWVTLMCERHARGHEYVCGLADVRRLMRERDEARAEVERMRRSLAGEAAHIQSLEGLLVDAVRERDKALAALDDLQRAFGGMEAALALSTEAYLRSEAQLDALRRLSDERLERSE